METQSASDPLLVPSPAFGAALKFLGNLALLVFSFAILDAVGYGLLILLAADLYLPHFAVWSIIIVGYGLQVFSALWFIGLAAIFWGLFIGSGNTMLKVRG
jgi:hypothetical protein